MKLITDEIKAEILKRLSEKTVEAAIRKERTKIRAHVEKTVKDIVDSPKFLRFIEKKTRAVLFNAFDDSERLWNMGIVSKARAEIIKKLKVRVG